METPVTSQPVPWPAGSYPGQSTALETEPYSDPNAELFIRNMVEDDADFAGRMTVEAFRPKYEWAAGKNRIEGVIRATQRGQRRNISQYPRIFVALYNGERAGVMTLQFHGDRSAEGGGSDYCREVGCCGACGLLCMDCALFSETVERGSCYLATICVDSKFRGKGVGKALMERGDYEAKKMSCKYIELFVARENRAKHLYLREGYKVVDEADGCLITWCAVGIRYWLKMRKTLY